LEARALRLGLLGDGGWCGSKLSAALRLENGVSVVHEEDLPECDDE